ncbi:CDP-alcohol phosphatidyltransferase family protein [Frigidibacter sp. RF13]|uniref:CDP-alcohol phosphatidyltransferase family protein n=1 Tax=Frigidibacter sp. RF13 TaxID=2997340 RepID=UPI002271F518|nr:CDP-alcohol phosphatidyltransferase family protein [Frigidibacter sp. RF13]MCY1126766.1 CDP-alcohol phosphatidyltransferase family protein [Frigidibacter sp. RF13]
MIDRFLLPMQHAVLRPPARLIAARGVTADQITLAAFGIGALAVPALAAGWYGLALALILTNRALDGLDGAVARETQATDRGAFIDIAADFLFYGLVPLGFALANPPANALAAAFLIASFIGTGSSFLAFATIAARRGEASTAYPAKGIYYLGGLTEGAETIALFIAMCLWPRAFPILAALFAILCLFTTGLRWHWGWQAFSSAKNDHRTDA